MCRSRFFRSGMDANSIRENAERLITPIAEELGYSIVEIVYAKNGKENDLTVVIYKKGGITLEDCVRMNDALDAPLEQNDITGGAPYNLNVSSPGLDRPIISDADFERNFGETVEAFLAKDGKKKPVVGELLSHDAESVVLRIKGAPKRLPKSEITLLRPHVSFD